MQSPTHSPMQSPASLAFRRDALLDLARFTTDPAERLAAQSDAARLDEGAIASEYTEALSDLLEASR